MDLLILSIFQIIFRWIMASSNCLLCFSIIIASTAYFYSIFIKYKTREINSLEQIVLDTWGRIIEEPSAQFGRILVG